MNHPLNTRHRLAALRKITTTIVTLQKMIINKKLKWNSIVIGGVRDNKTSKTRVRKIMRKKKALRSIQMTFLESRASSTNIISKSITRLVHSLGISSRTATTTIKQVATLIVFCALQSFRTKNFTCIILSGLQAQPQPGVLPVTTE